MKEFRFVESVFIDGYDGKRWLSCSLPIEETFCGDKYKIQFRPHEREDLPWETHIATLYGNRLTDQNLLDIPMEREGVQEWDKYDLIVTKCDMTQQDKELLLKDLCARLPYGIKISPKEKDTGEYDKTTGSNYMYPDVINVEAFIPDGDNTRIEYGDWIVYLDNIQLYLRPMSSMTDEEKDEYDRLVMCNASWVVDDWLNAHQFDYRGLIPMGLALEAKEGMYKN